MKSKKDTVALIVLCAGVALFNNINLLSLYLESRINQLLITGYNMRIPVEVAAWASNLKAKIGLGTISFENSNEISPSSLIAMLLNREVIPFVSNLN
jgi:hypothetical protein